MMHLTNRGVEERSNRVRKLRNAAVQLAERYGEWEDTNIGRVRAGKRGHFFVVSTKTFQRRPGSSDDVGSSRALRAERGAPVGLERAYGVDVWADLHVGAKVKPMKVLSLEWDDAGTIDAITFKRGPWESELLALTLLEASA